MTTLKAVTTKIGSGATPRGGASVYVDEGAAFIRSQNVLDLCFSNEGLARIGEDAAEGLRNVAVEPGDVLVNITGDSVARVALWPRNEPARVSQHVAIVRCDPAQVDARYMQYWLHAPAQKAQLLTLSAAGASRPALTKGMLEAFPFGPHPLAEQKAIAEVLGALDDKIAANRRVIDTADNLIAVRSSMLRADAPNTKPLVELVRFNYGKALPAAAREPGDVAVVGSGGVVGSHNVSLVDGPAVVLGRKGSVGATYWIDGPTYAIDTTYWVEPLGVSLHYAYYLLRSIDFASMSTDSAVPGLNRSRAYALDVAMPSTEELARFDRFARPVTASMGAAKTANETLAKTRDELLTLLMSGKITVRDAEKRVEGVV